MLKTDKVMSETKTFYFPEAGSQNQSFDNGLLWASLMNGGGFGMNGGAWIWPLFLLALWGNGGFGGFGGWGNGGVGRGGFGFLSNQINEDTGRQLVMQAINNNGDAVRSLASQLNCSIGDVQTAINGLSSQICAVGNQVGMSSQQIINAIERGDCNIAGQIASCCCDLKQLLSQGFASVGYETAQQTCSIEKAIAGSTSAITARLDAMEKTNLLDKLDALREKNSTLTTQLNLEHQNQYTAGVVSQAVAPVNAALGDLGARLAKIECSQPPTFPMPYVPASGGYIPVNYSVPMHFGTNYNSCGYNC